MPLCLEVFLDGRVEAVLELRLPARDNCLSGAERYIWTRGSHHLPSDSSIAFASASASFVEAASLAKFA